MASTTIRTIVSDKCSSSGSAKCTVTFFMPYINALITQRSEPPPYKEMKPNENQGDYVNRRMHKKIKTKEGVESDYIDLDILLGMMIDEYRS